MNIADGRQAFSAPAKLNLDLRITGRAGRRLSQYRKHILPDRFAGYRIFETEGRRQNHPAQSG
uniref:Uncharacterized protein n=1 Tax=Neisseria meningitidis alpha275 TaxID=295996 RepID=C6SKQ9_NEIME|nr:hypothetical protein predicted by Glimmer/Critica [Neisseria meningitidis alpha275]